MAHPVTTFETDTGEDSIFDRNINALRANNAKLAEHLLSLASGYDDAEFPGWEFAVRPARNGADTMFAVNGETEVALHSVYNPLREAADQIRGAAGDIGRNYFVFLGFGLGYAVEELISSDESNIKALVVEPHLAAFLKALQSRDLTSILRDPRVVFALGTNLDNVIANFLQRYQIADVTGVGFIEISGRSHLPSSGFFSKMLERLKGVLVTTGGNLQTLMLMAWEYQKNTMMSLGYIADSPPVRTVFGAFENKPAIIVSAGPSLQKNIDQIKDYTDRAVIIAVDTSLRPLLAAGVEPHFICTGDPQEANWKHLRGTETSNAYLVAEPMTHSMSLEYFKDRLFIASYGDKVMQWVDRYLPPVGHVACWGSVATMAFDLARKMKCDPIIFVGQDLSYPGGRTYVKGTYFEDEMKMDMSVEAFEKNHTIYTLTDIHGEPVKTNRQMFAYSEWFRTEFTRTEARVINATEGGILRENCEIMPLKEAADKYLNTSFEALPVIRSAGRDFEGYDLTDLQQAVFDTIKSMNKCVDLCERGLGKIKEAVNSILPMNTLPQVYCAKLIAELDGYRFQLLQEPALKNFLETANQTGVLNFHRGYRSVNGKDFSRVMFERALDLFTGLFMSTARTARGIMPFFTIGFKHLHERTGAGNLESRDVCQKTEQT